MNITVLIFSHLKAALETGSLTLELKPGATTDDIKSEIRSRLPVNMADMPLHVAVNQVYVREVTALKQGDEVALIPPVQGG
ncbi:MAG: MoaD/ThiS family protein [Candidatus Marinimicrobia bacterium]|nr:MoaD/ThiS family protein [Candidatus Neomarinimicrobiota bacterium]